jgi:hypothetical protein
MEKAFDLKALAAELEAQGLPLLEDGAEKAYAALKTWLKKSAEIQGGLVGGILPAALDAIDGFVTSNIDKIDGAEG